MNPILVLLGIISGSMKWSDIGRSLLGVFSLFADPTYASDLQASTLDDMVMEVAWNNFFVDTPKQAWLRSIGAVNPFDGGVLMRVPTIFNRPLGGAIAPGSTVTIVHRQQLANLAFTARLYSSFDNLETFSLLVQNRGEASRVNLEDLYAQLAIEGLNTDVEVDSFHHGQSPVVGFITDDGSQRINGDDEAMNNGYDPGWYGNVYQNYGAQARNGSQTNTLNSTPYWYGNPDGTSAAITVEGLTQHMMRVLKFGNSAGNVIGITSQEGIAYIYAMFQRQQRLVEWKVEDTCPGFTGIGFMGAMLYGDTLAPGRNWAQTLPPEISQTSNTTDTAGTSTAGQPYSFTSPTTVTTYSGIPASTQISVGEPLFLYSGRSIEYRPTTVPEFLFGVRRNEVYNSNTLDAYIVNLALNLYYTMPRENSLGYGFSS